MKNERLFEIVWLLMKNKMLSAQVLADHFEVSIRTIYRDIETLSMANIPIYTQPGKNGGVALMEHFVLDKMVLSEEEKNQILVSLQANGFDSETNKQTLSKISSLFLQDTLDWIEVDFSNWVNPKKEADYFEVMKDAIFSKHCLNINYLNSNGENKKRKVDPYKLYFRGQAWYLYAFCHLRKEFRWFKLLRIHDLKVSEETFIRKEMVEEPRAKYLTVNNDIEALLKIDKKLSYRVQEELHPYIIKEDDHYYFVKVKMDEQGLFYYLMSFGEQAELLKPVHLRDKMRERIEKLNLIYKP